MAGKKISPNGIYELLLLNGYTLEEDEETIVIYDNERGIGAVRISCYQIPDDYIFEIEEELKDFISSVDSNSNPKILEENLLNEGYAYCEFLTREDFWRIWIFFKKPHAIFATYNCSKKDKENEREKIDKIMKSFCIID